MKGLIGEEEAYLHRIIDAVMFRVMPEQERTTTGIVDFEANPHIKEISQASHG